MLLYKAYTDYGHYHNNHPYVLNNRVTLYIYLYDSASTDSYVGIKIRDPIIGEYYLYQNQANISILNVAYIINQN